MEPSFIPSSIDGMVQVPDALARLLTGPRLRIGPRDLVALGRRARALASGEGDGRAVTRAAAVEQDAQDALAEAVTDLTAETGSLVEALDDLGEPAAYSRVGYTRMHALAGELRRLRAHIGRPLSDTAVGARAALSTWIFTIARNLRIDRLRREVCWQELSDEDRLTVARARRIASASGSRMKAVQRNRRLSAAM